MGLGETGRVIRTSAIIARGSDTRGGDRRKKEEEGRRYLSQSFGWRAKRIDGWNVRHGRAINLLYLYYLLFVLL